MSSLSLNMFDLLSDEGAGGRRRKLTTPKPAPAPVVAPTPTPAPAKTAAAAPASKPAAQQPTDKKAPNAKPANANAGAKKENGTARPPRPQGEGQRGKGERRPQQGGAGTPPVARQAAGGDEAFPQQKTPAHQFAGERRERAPARGRKFDRRSGTGRPPTENKRSGSGKANWGKLGENEEEVAAQVTKENGEAEKEETEKVTVEGEAAAAAEGEAAPKEPETKSLDEYYQELKNKAVKVEAPKKREAGEGVDQSAWKEYVPLAKEEASDSLAPKTKKKEGEKKEAPASVAADLLSFTLAPPQGIEERGRRRDRGDRQERGDRPFRGGRGRGRGGRGGPRNQQRGARPASEGPAVAFAADDFPVLGAKPAAAAPAPVKA